MTRSSHAILGAARRILMVERRSRKSSALVG